MIRSVIVDDEKKSREVLKSLLNLYCPEVDVVEVAHDIPSALDAIKRVSPDLVFLDISLKDGDSFMILDRLETINFNIIFITAFDEYSVKALNYSGIPCLFKPVDIEELSEEVKSVSNTDVVETANKYKYADHLLKSKFSKIPILSEGGISVLEQEKISSFHKVKNGVQIKMQDGKMVFSKRSLKSFKGILSAHNFYSIDESLMINLLQVNVPPERFRNRVKMKNGDKFSIDKSKNKSFWDDYKKHP